MTAKIPVQILILSHANTDFDGFAGMLAAQLLYPGARICLHGGVNRNVREFYNLHAEQIPSVEPSAVDVDSVRTLALVEVSDAARLGQFEQLARDERVEVVVFDHHGEPTIDGAMSFIAQDGSLVTNMLKLLIERSIEVTPLQATAFALGIHEDTGSLTYSSTTQRDVEALAACMRMGCNQELLARYLRGPLQPEQRELLRRLDSDPCAARGRGAEGGHRSCRRRQLHRGRVDAGLAYRRHRRLGRAADGGGDGGKGAVVGRSRTSAVAIDRALEPIGGGGHAQAASAVVRDADPAAVLERALSELEKVAKPPLLAADVMSRPVHAVSSQDEISAALVECQRLGLSGIQVADDGQLSGVVAREDLDRAVRHGLSHAPVKAVMSAGVAVVGRQATIGELRDLLAGGRAKRLVVVPDGPYRTEEQVAAGAAEGVITGGDVLRALREPLTVQKPVPSPEASEAVKARLAGIERLQRILPQVQAVAAAYDGVYLVGGAVRDVLLGEQSLDLDLMVEGDAIAFARELAQELGGRAHPHEKFQTSVVKALDGEGGELRVDVASARTEFYGAPGRAARGRALDAASRPCSP